jgi:hypothetical protein
MEPEGSLPRSQDPSTGPFPEPHQSNPSKIHFNIVHPPTFMEPEVSILYSQEPSTGLYPEPDQCNPYRPILANIHFNVLLPPASWSS